MLSYVIASTVDMLFTEGNVASQADVLAVIENLNKTGKLPVSKYVGNIDDK